MTLSADDRLDLSDLVHRYASHINARRFDDLAELFTDTVELTLPDPPGMLGPTLRYQGRTGALAAMEALGHVIRTHHAIVGEIYAGTSQPATATGSVTAVAHHWSEHDDRLTDVVWYLHYADEYRRTGIGWRIARRALSIDAIETRPARQVRDREP